MSWFSFSMITCLAKFQRTLEKLRTRLSARLRASWTKSGANRSGCCCRSLAQAFGLRLEVHFQSPKADHSGPGYADVHPVCSLNWTLFRPTVTDCSSTLEQITHSHRTRSSNARQDRSPQYPDGNSISRASRDLALAWFVVVFAFLIDLMVETQTLQAAPGTFFGAGKRQRLKRPHL